MNFIIVAYYTRDTIYEQQARRLAESLNKFKVPYDIWAVDNQGTWLKNTGYKPTFIKQMLNKHKPTNIVYVDADAEFKKYPILFETFEGDIGVYVFDRSEYKRSKGGIEVLSGTIFLKNNDRVLDIVEQWEAYHKMHITQWDQKSLEHVLKGDYSLLPGEYCKIFDRMSKVIDPVIVHYQASRLIRRQRTDNLSYS